jgi:hypothetical protein
MNKTTSREKNETMLGLYALTANKTSKPTSCPSDENMAAFIDHQLSGKDRRIILKHLNHCPTCYKDWMASCEVFETLQPSRANNITFWENVWQEINNYRQLWYFGLPTAAVSAMIALMMIWPSSNNINQQISDLYSQKIVHSEHYQVAIKKMPLPWEKTSLGFGLTPLSAATRAYGAGIWKGRVDLLRIINQPLPEKLLSLNNTLWRDSDWSDYYVFGRWTVMLWTVLESGQEINNWQNHKLIKDKLLTNLSKQPTTDNDALQANLALNKISHLLAKVEQTNDQVNINQLIHELKLTMYRLGPDHL